MRRVRRRAASPARLRGAFCVKVHLPSSDPARASHRRDAVKAFARAVEAGLRAFDLSFRDAMVPVPVPRGVGQRLRDVQPGRFPGFETKTFSTPRQCTGIRLGALADLTPTRSLS